MNTDQISSSAGIDIGVFDLDSLQPDMELFDWISKQRPLPFRVAIKLPEVSAKMRSIPKR